MPPQRAARERDCSSRWAAGRPLSGWGGCCTPALQASRNRSGAGSAPPLSEQGGIQWRQFNVRKGTASAQGSPARPRTFGSRCSVTQDRSRRLPALAGVLPSYRNRQQRKRVIPATPPTAAEGEAALQPSWTPETLHKHSGILSRRSSIVYSRDNAPATSENWGAKGSAAFKGPLTSCFFTHYRITRRVLPSPHTASFPPLRPVPTAFPLSFPALFILVTHTPPSCPGGSQGRLHYSIILRTTSEVPEAAGPPSDTPAWLSACPPSPSSGKNGPSCRGRAGRGCSGAWPSHTGCPEGAPDPGGGRGPSGEPLLPPGRVAAQAGWRPLAQ